MACDSLEPSMTRGGLRGWEDLEVGKATMARGSLQPSKTRESSGRGDVRVG